MANILTHPTNGAIYFDDGTAGSSSVPALTGDAVSLNYDGSAGLNITSYNTTSTDRFSIDGDSGRLFSVNDSLTGTIFSVNDAAGLPIIEVESTSSTDTITMGTYASNALVVAGDRVGIGTASPGSSYKLDVTGDVNINGDIVLGGKLDFSGNITAATSDTDVFVVIDAGELKTRTGAQVASDIGLGNVTNESKATMFSSPSFTGTPVAPTASANTNTTQIATTEYVQTEIGELIGGAPAALDTLNELAAAIGDDASYASSITTALAAKAPLASPNFTGDVDVAGSITTEGPDGGMVMRTWTGGGSYGMIGTANMSSGEYSLLTDGTSTYLSGGTGGNVYIRGGNNDSSPQITVSGGNIGLAGVPSKASEATAIVWDGTNIGYRELGSAAFSATSAFAAASHTQAFSTITSTPTTVAGYGITDAVATSALSSYLPLAGGTIDGSLVIDTDTGSQPFYVKRSGGLDQALKLYVDDQNVIFESIQDETADDYGGFIFNMDAGTTHPYFDVRKNNSTIMRVDGSGNVGIGTTSLTNSSGYSTLSISGTTGAQIAFQTAGTGKHYLYSSALDFNIYNSQAGNIRLYTSASERMRITSSGNVGIGTTSPTVNLHVESSTSAQFKVGNGTQFLRLYADADEATILADGSVDMRFYTAGAEKMRIDTNGNVGIGTTSPAQRLHVSGGHILLDNNKQIRFKDSGATERTIIQLNSSNDLAIGGSYAGALTFMGGGSYTEQMRIHDNGNVGIGTTSPARKLHVSTGNTDVAARFENTSSNGTVIEVVTSGDSKTLQIQTDHILANAALHLGSDSYNTYIRGANVGIGTTSPNVSLEVHGADITSSSNTTAASVLRLVRDITDSSYTLRKDSAVDFMLSRQQASANNLPYTRLDIRLAGTTDSSTPSLDVMSLLHNGNVGIGTTSPSSKLEVVEATANTAAAITVDSASWDAMLSLKNANGTWTILNDYTGAGTTGALAFWNGSYRMVIDNTGKVGIGTTNPSNKLTVEDTIGIKRSGVAAITTLQQNGSGLTLNAPAGYHPFIIKSNGVEKVRFANTGNVGIGTTNPDEKLEVAGKTHLGGRGQDGGAYIGYASLSETQGGAATILGNAVYAGNANNVYRKTSGDVGNFIKMVYSKGITFHTNVTGNAGSTEYSVENNEQMRIDLNGNVGIGATAPSVGLQLGNSTSGQTKTAIFNSEGGVEAGLTIKSRTNRAKLAVSDNDTTAYVVAEGTIASFGRADTAASTNISVLANGDVGIGTTSPSRLLTLENNSSTVTNNSQLRINNAGAGDAYIYLFAGSDWSLGIDNSDSDKFKLCTTNDVSDGTEVVTVDRNGNVGIGTTSPQAKLQVSGGIQMADDTDTASAAKVGTMRYRTATNEPVAVTGIELVTNGNFATASSWTKSSNVTISGGQATFTANSAAQYIIQGSLWAANSLSGQKVQLTYTIVSNSLNAGDFRIGGYTGASAFTLQGLPATVGTHSVTLDVRTSGGDDNAIDIYITSPATSGALVIDNLSLIHVTEEDASYADMCMQTAASTYEWVNIVRNSY
jgi:hypothetical protein